MKRLTLSEVQALANGGVVQGPFSALVDLKLNRTWAVTFLHTYVVLERDCDNKIKTAIKPLDRNRRTPKGGY